MSAGVDAKKDPKDAIQLVDASEREVEMEQAGVDYPKQDQPAQKPDFASKLA